MNLYNVICVKFYVEACSLGNLLFCDICLNIVFNKLVGKGMKIFE